MIIIHLSRMFAPTGNIGPPHKPPLVGLQPRVDIISESGVCGGITTSIFGLNEQKSIKPAQTESMPIKKHRRRKQTCRKQKMKWKQQIGELRFGRLCDILIQNILSFKPVVSYSDQCWWGLVVALQRPFLQQTGEIRLEMKIYETWTEGWGRSG